ncbi:MAG: MerR family transcriptional regulator [Coriobacteriales bacterium]|nr:MerR family transcriptional regulator [Coriobacteriales bacterium]
MSGYSVGEVAKLAHVSVRTLHHYDEIGLLEPSSRSESGYRLYDDGDLERLQQVLFFRELGFPLDEIRRVMSDPAFDRREALLEQRESLAARVLHAEALLQAVDRAIGALEEGETMDKEEMFEVFGDFDPSQYEDEVKERWGDTDAYAESARRTKRYTKEDWKRFKAEQDELQARIVALFDEGVEPADPKAMDVADEARLQIDTWFYPLSREGHVCLGEMYVADPRFEEFYDKQREGLAQWFCDAIKANAGR